MIKTLSYSDFSFDLNTDMIVEESVSTLYNEAIDSVFSDFPISEPLNGKSAIQFFFAESFNTVWNDTDPALIMENNHFANGKYLINNHGASIVLNTQEGITKIYFKIDFQGNSNLNRLKNSGFYNQVELQINMFYYRVFLPFIQYTNTSHNSTFIHASSFKYKDKGFMLASTSGVGKSSTLMGLSRLDDVQFIADDLSVLSNSGLRYFGRKMSVKPYHLEYFPWLSEISTDGMPILQKIQWKLLKGRKKLVYSLKISNLFQNRKADQVEINKIIHLSNSNSDKFEIDTISKKEFIDISCSILNAELFLGMEFINKINYFPAKHLFLTLTEYNQRMKEIMDRQIGEVEIVHVKVPYRSNPNKLSDFIVENVLSI